jgi:hypothetical protein
MSAYASQVMCEAFVSRENASGMRHRSIVVLCAVASFWFFAYAAGAKAEEPASAEDHYFKSVVRPAVPPVSHTKTVKNEIDSFILAALENASLSLSAPADKQALLRRVTYDLTGLSPTVEEQNAFLADNSPDAYERVVDRLLGSPRFGEHMAQDWLDLVRYAETAGFKIDEERLDAYRYRDYVVRSFNDDLPYHRFVAQQLAGDELEPDNPDAVVATGFLRLYPEESNASNFRLSRQNILDDITEVTGLSFFGMTVGCAKCHDHKFDPILQSDYYELQAFFAPFLPKNGVPLGSAEQKAEYSQKESLWNKATLPIRDKIDRLIAPVRTKAMNELASAFDPETQRACLKPDAERTPMEQQLAALASREVEKKMNRVPRYLDDEARKQYDALEKELQSFDPMRPAPLPTAMAIGEVDGPPPPTFVLATGNYSKPIKEVAPDYPEFLEDDDPKFNPPQRAATSKHTTGRRSALAHWLANSDHPLFARVMVNRMWQHHFGRGIVGTPNDFGAMGESATHPELLDWLAAEFIDRGFSMKQMHRLMVLSAVYRQAASVDKNDLSPQKAQQIDPSNKLLWHFRRVRLRGETVRDAILQISGDLNLTMYGASSRPELPAALTESRYAWEPDSNVADRHRRSIYLFARRNLRDPILAAFDPPDRISSCARRSFTVTAPQALTLLNGKMALDQSRRWAGRLLAETAKDRTRFITAAYRQAFGRRPLGGELADADQFLSEQSRMIDASEALEQSLLPEPMPREMRPAEAAATVDFCHALMNASEFLFVD